MFLSFALPPLFPSVGIFSQLFAGERLERLAGNPKKDADIAKILAPLDQAAKRLTGQAAMQPELDKLKWMIEELRVSLFAQDLKTAIPVSEKRVAEQLEKARKEAAT